MRAAPSRFPPRSVLPGHRHARAYAAIVLDGSYEERSADGRWRVEAGDIVVHSHYHLHANRFLKSGAHVLDLDCSDFPCETYGVFSAVDTERVARGACRVEEALSGARPRASLSPPPWIAALAERLDRNAGASVIAESRHAGRSREHVARAFAGWFGLSPRAYACERRLHRALSRIKAGGALAEAAVCEGYCDQSHMIREMKRRLNVTPGAVRAAHPR